MISCTIIIISCIHSTCVTSSSFSGNDELVAAEDSIDVGNVLWIFYDCLWQIYIYLFTTTAPSTFCKIRASTNETKYCKRRFTLQSMTYVGVCTLNGDHAYWCYLEDGGWSYCPYDCQKHYTGKGSHQKSTMYFQPKSIRNGGGG